MKNNMKKIVTLLVVAALALGLVFAIRQLTKPETHQGSKAITITIVDGTTSTTLLESKTFYTDADYLYGLLEENSDELQLDASKTDYGMTVNGLMGLTTEDWNAGPWWVYESENSECCKANGYCPSVDQCAIVDGESYVFTFMTY